MSSNYFKLLGNVWFTLPDGIQVLINDITKFANITSEYRDNPYYHMKYKINDYDRPELLSYKLYDTVDNWWTILLLNDIYDFDNQWPIQEANLLNYIREKYPLNNINDVHHYETVDGYVTDIESMSDLYDVSKEDVIGTYNLSPVSIWDYEYNLNENKRNIKLIDPDKMSKFLSDFKAVFNEK